jgi:hypothetical protein
MEMQSSGPLTAYKGVVPMRRSAWIGSSLAVAILLPAAALAHPPDAGTLETVVSLDASQLEMPESLEIDREGPSPATEP